MDTIKWAVNKMPKTEDSNLKVMGLDEIKKARAFHESFPQYSVTPLAKLDHMAKRLGLGEVYVKDESYRFGLNAFKVLGGSFAMARYIAKQTGKDVSELPYNVLTSEKLKEVRAGHILHRHRRQSRPRCCMGRKQIRAEGSRPHAERKHTDETEQHSCRRR